MTKKTPTYIALIPARKGSKRLVGKNLKPLHGIPLISYTIRAARFAPSISETFVTTDSSEIRGLALSEGCGDLPLRPDALAQDGTSSPDVVRFELDRIRKSGKTVDYVVLLQPTSPLRTADDIESAIKLFEMRQADTLTSMTEDRDSKGEVWVQEGNWFRPFPTSLGLTEKFYRENGAIYILSRQILESGRFYGDKVIGFEMPHDRSVDIDTIKDFEAADQYLTNRPSTSR